MDRLKVISLNISTYTYSETIDKIIELGKRSASAYCCFANTHMVIEAYDNPLFSDYVNQANIVSADGVPIVIVIKKIFNRKIERVAGMDMMPSILESASKANLSVFFFGSTNDILNKIEKNAKKLYPSLSIAGSFSPPFKKLSNEENENHIQLINDSGADIVFVALGCPKQEKWMAENTAKINAVLLGVGAAFPVFAGSVKRAPKWFRNMSLEWLYRLGQNPRRLFKRYLYTNTKFIYLMAKQLIKR